MITRYKNRYILVESSAPINTQDKQTSSSFLSAMHKQVGEMGHAEMNPKPAYQYNPNVFIIRVNRGSERKAILALSFVKDVNGSKIGFYTIKMSGTIRTLIEYCKNTYN